MILITSPEVDLLVQIFEGSPRLRARAACRDRPELFNQSAQNDPDRTERKALRICKRCPALDDCRSWVSGMDPAQRPAGVVGGLVFVLDRSTLTTHRKTA